jgi:hypothetical protein
MTVQVLQRLQSVRVSLPDEPAALSLVCEAIGRFSAELVEDPAGYWNVDFHVDHRLRTQLDRDVLSLVDRWLVDARIPRAAVYVDGVPRELALPGDHRG